MLRTVPGIKNSVIWLSSRCASTVRLRGVFTFSSCSPKWMIFPATELIFSSSWRNQSTDVLWRSCKFSICFACVPLSSLNISSNRSHFRCWRSWSILKSFIVCENVSCKKSESNWSLPTSLLVRQVSRSMNSTTSNGSWNDTQYKLQSLVLIQCVRVCFFLSYLFQLFHILWNHFG